MMCEVCPSTAVSYDLGLEMYVCQTCGHSWFPDDEYEDAISDFTDDDFDIEFDCGFQPGFGCLYAGSEDCDFDCPYRDSLHRHPDYPNVVLSDF